MSFNSIIENTEATSKLMPSTHTCDAFSFRDIMSSASINVSDCKVFKGENLLYLFYGRPSYKLSNPADTNSYTCNLPICFLIRTNKTFEHK